MNNFPNWDSVILRPGKKIMLVLISARVNNLGPRQTILLLQKAKNKKSAPASSYEKSCFFFWSVIAADCNAHTLEFRLTGFIDFLSGASVFRHGWLAACQNLVGEKTVIGKANAIGLAFTNEFPGWLASRLNSETQQLRELYAMHTAVVIDG